MDMQQELMPGATVYGADGEKVGTIAGVGGSYVVVEKGFFFPEDYYIPVSAVTDASSDAVHLSVTKDEALHQGWNEAPVDAQGTTQPYTDEVIGSGYVDRGTVGEQDRLVDEETLTVPVYEERLDATARPAEAGEVMIHKQVVEEQETIAVPVTEERVRVEWREPTGEVNADGAVFEEGVIEVPVSREVVDVSKRTVQTGELEVTKQREQRTQKVTDSVRREVVDVEDTTGEELRTDR